MGRWLIFINQRLKQRPTRFDRFPVKKKRFEIRPTVDLVVNTNTGGATHLQQVMSCMKTDPLRIQLFLLDY